jgi:hypothetical protein
MEIKNDGDAHARLQGSAFIKDASGEIVAQTPLNAVVLNDGERTYDVKLQDTDKLKTGESYKIDFDLNNSFSPQNKFKKTNVAVNSIEYVAK